MVGSVAPANGLAADLAYQVTVLVRARAVLVRARAVLARDADEDVAAPAWSPLTGEPGEPVAEYVAPGVM